MFNAKHGALAFPETVIGASTLFEISPHGLQCSSVYSSHIQFCYYTSTSPPLIFLNQDNNSITKQYYQIFQKVERLNACCHRSMRIYTATASLMNTVHGDSVLPHVDPSLPLQSTAPAWYLVSETLCHSELIQNEH